MRRSIGAITLFLALCGISGTVVAAPTATPKPLRASEVLALVGGAVVPENIVRTISTDGLAFRPDAFYRGLLKTAGADPKVIAAVNSGRVVRDQNPETESGQTLLEQIADAASAIKARQYVKASADLKAALVSSFGSPDCFFVTAELFGEQEEWDQAAAADRQVLAQDSNYPDAHTKLSYMLYRSGDAQDALQEAYTQLHLDPEDAAAHRNAGMALAAMHEFDAANREFAEAVRLKPDYGPAHWDWGNMYLDEYAWDKAIAEFRKALPLMSADDSAGAALHYNLGFAYDQEANLQSAMREYRESIRMDPKRYDSRQNLGSDLEKVGQFSEAVSVFRDLEALYPDAEMCRVGLGQALFATWDLAGAEKEYRQAILLDPTDPMAHTDLGDVFDTQKKYDAALAEYERAEQIDPTTIEAFQNAGRTLLKMADFSRAIAQLEHAEELAPGNAYVHDLSGQALIASAKTDAAISEFQQSLALHPKQVQVILRLADAFEKKGDWVAAMGAYRRASLTDAAIDLRGKVLRNDERDPQNEYAAAQKRFEEHLEALRASGESAEAAKLKSAVVAARSAPSVSQQLDELMQQGAAADHTRRFDEAIKDYQQAVAIAETMQPHDPRLVTALDDLGNNYFGWNATAAESAYERELQAAQQVYGPESANLAGPLQSLGRNALMQHQYAAAEKFFFQAVDLNEKVFGESSDKVAESLVQASAVYFVEKDYPKAEPYLLRAVHIDESLYGIDSISMATPLSALCSLYDRWGKPDKLEIYNRQLLAVFEKQYGPSSPVIVPVLVSEAKALRELGKNVEAEKFDDRAASLRSATMKPN